MYNTALTIKHQYNQHITSYNISQSELPLQLLHYYQIQMQNHSVLEDKLRRSTSLLPHDLYKSFMAYALTVRDAQQVYNHMQENDIGINEPQFWLARLQIMKKRCQFVQIVQMLQKIAQNHQLHQYHPWDIYRHKDYYMLMAFKNKLDRDMLDFTRSKYRGKRKVQQFQLFSTSNILKEQRMIGGSLVYVDPQCRMAYLLEDYSKFIAQNFKSHIQEERNYYDRSQEGKPFSFISKRTKSLEQLAQELIAKQPPAPTPARKSARMSTAHNKINIIENCETPKNLKPLRQSVTPQDNPQHRDSVQILKEIRASLSQNENSSPTFGVVSNSKQIQSILSPPQSLPVQRARPQKNSQQMGFSFGKQNDKTQIRQNNQDESQQQCINNNAFIFQSFSNSSKSSHSPHHKQIIKKQDFQLQLIIKQTQREHYQQQSNHHSSKKEESQLDSNQQNYQTDTLFDDRSSFPKRKPFQILYRREDNNQAENKNEFVIDLSHLLQMNDNDLDEQNTKQHNSNHNSQIRIIVSPQSSGTKQRKPHLYYSGRQNRTSMLSLISEENSLISHSQTKPRLSKGQ